MEENLKKKEISQEEIEKFIEGRDPMERIVNIMYEPNTSRMTIFYRNEEDQKCVRKEDFYPFCWATLHACKKLCNGNRDELKKLLHKYNIGVKRLNNTSINGDVVDKFDNGYLFMFYAKEPMSYQRFLSFFKEGKNPVYAKKDKDGNNIYEDKNDERQYLIVTPAEQFMIKTGKRFFKGYFDYDEIYRMIFDLETEGLDPYRHRISQIGIRTNRGFEKIFTIEGTTKEERDRNELRAIDMMLRIIYTYKPDVITAHNGENFDWNFIIVRCLMLGTTMEEMSAKYFDGNVIRKEEKESILKLGGEIETYHRTIVPYTIITDSLHAVRRAQAIDSNMLHADLKYATRYAKMVKPNRVYVPGDKINSTWADKVNKYAFNDENGSWYLITDDTPLKDGYVETTGRYIVERYLLDDLWECDKVEHKFNTTNFLICKLLPVPYEKCTTMGTAGQWKALMLAWSYENNLAIPLAENTGAFTGGLSRLLKVGYVDNVVKLDYNSLYPSIILTWGISDWNDLMNAMLKMLEYVLTQRESFKGLKKNAGKIVDELKSKVQGKTATADEINDFNKAGADYAFNDKKQAQMKVFGNSFFGSYGSNNGSVFPWKSPKCAEQTTCTGRQCLRLMISHFSKLGYQPIVGDSFTGDTPLFIKYNDTGFIDIKPIEELIGATETDVVGREYDTSEKPYKVLCRSGWAEPKYIYRHKTNKPIYEVTDGNMSITVTEDHSLYNDKYEKIKPSQITNETKLEYYNKKIKGDKNISTIDETMAKEFAQSLMDGKVNRVPLPMLNTDNKEAIKTFLDGVKNLDQTKISKTCLAGINFLKNYGRF